ncbi:MAG TPA: glycosyltransferase [Isosphaeraceae bacterium]|nr:glycosyltransferase [Isosphaeraceae bacterium]
MHQDPLHVLWVEPHFPGRLGAFADWLVRRRGYRCWFYCHTADPREHWPASVGHGLEVQTFGVGGVARERTVAWWRTLERSLCYSYGCWEVLEARRPRPIDLIVGRSAGLGSTLFAPVYAPAPPRVNLFDYYFHPCQNDVAGEITGDAAIVYTHWRRSNSANDLLDLEHCDLAWTQTHWQRQLYPAEYRDDFWVQHDGVATPRSAGAGTSLRKRRFGPRSIAGRTIPADTRVVSFVARSLERLRGFDRFWHTANALLRARSDLVCVVVGDPVVQRGLDVEFHNRDYPAFLSASSPSLDPDRFWFLSRVPPGQVAELLRQSDLHLAPGRPYPVARSLLEAMAAGCVVLASNTAPHREVIGHGHTGLLVNEADSEAFIRQALTVLDDPAAHSPLGLAASELVQSRYAQEVCLPRLAERFSALAESARRG